MSDEIVEKIQVQLDKGIETKATCVYLLAQIRKYLEQQRVGGFWNLKMRDN